MEKYYNDGKKGIYRQLGYLPCSPIEKKDSTLLSLIGLLIVLIILLVILF